MRSVALHLAKAMRRDILRLSLRHASDYARFATSVGKSEAKSEAQSEANCASPDGNFSLGGQMTVSLLVSNQSDPALDSWAKVSPLQTRLSLMVENASRSPIAMFKAAALVREAGRK